MNVRWPRGREVSVEKARQEANEQTAAIVEELHKAELVRDKLEGLDQIARSYLENHHTRVLLENLHLDRAVEAVEEDIRSLRDALLHPSST
jgi:hypothetical protein